MTVSSSIHATFIVGLLPLAAACATSTHFVRGTIVNADPAGVTVRHKSGQVVHASVAPSTTYRWDHQAAVVHDLVPGVRVMVILEQGRGPFRAKEIRIFSRPTRSAKPNHASDGQGRGK